MVFPRRPFTELDPSRKVAMRHIPISSLLLVLILGLCLKAQETTPPEKPSPAPVPEALTDESLGALITSMGYENRKLKQGFLVVAKQDTWTLNVQLRLSDDKIRLGFNANLGKVENPGEIAASQWMELLVANGDIDPSSFYFDKDQKKLYLHRTTINIGITPEVLRRELDKFMAHIRKTEALWKFTK
jgi:hypothetical protein